MRVHSDPGQAVAGAQISRSGVALSETGADGRTRVLLSGSPGEGVDLQVDCPDGLRAPAAPLRVVLRSWVQSDRVPSYEARCAPTKRRLVVAVRTPHAAGLPLRYLGETIAQTDARGACHALLELPPGETVRLTLDTSGPEHTRLRPRDPELTLTVPDRSEIVVFDPSFTLAPRPKVRRKPSAKRSGGPVRI